MDSPGKNNALRTGKRDKRIKNRDLFRGQTLYFGREQGGLGAGGAGGRGPTGWKQELQGGRGRPGREMKGREGSWYAGCGAELSGRPKADRPRKLNAGGRGAGAALGAGRGPAIITLHISGSNGKSSRNPDKPRAPISRLTNVSESQKLALAQPVDKECPRQGDCRKQPFQRQKVIISGFHAGVGASSLLLSS